MVCSSPLLLSQDVKVERYGKDGLAFRVTAPKRTYEFRTASQDDAMEWMRNIEAAAEAAHASAPGGRLTKRGPQLATPSFREEGDGDDFVDDGTFPPQRGSVASSAGGRAGSMGGLGIDELALATQQQQPAGGSSGETERKKGLVGGIRAIGLGAILGKGRDNDRQKTEPRLPAPFQSTSSWVDVTPTNGYGGADTSPSSIVPRPGSHTPPGGQTNAYGSTRSVDSARSGLEEMAGDEFSAPEEAQVQSAEL